MAKLVLGVILVFVVVLCFLPTPCESESFWVSYQYTYTYYHYNCYPYYYTYCYNWWYYGYWYGWYYWNWYWWYYPYYYNYWCNTYVGYNCYTTYETAWATGWKCATGFTGGNCDIPICTNPAICTANQVCKIDSHCVGQTVCNVAAYPNYCTCKTNSAGQCILGACSDTKDCYPGSCASSGNTCDCPPGFSGPNCQTLSQRSSITTCLSQVLGYPPEGGNLQVVANTTCAAAGSDPVIVWIRSSRIERVEVVWEVHLDTPPKLPDTSIAPYIQSTPTIGIADSSFVVSWGTSKSNTKWCPTPNQYQTIVQCNPVTIQWSDLGFNIADNASFLISVSSHIGGQKTGASGVTYGGFQARPFSEDTTANQTIRSMKFAFDNTAPKHCLTTSNNCTVFPIFVNQSITSDPKIQPTFNEWKDSESGIQKFHVEIFYMQPDVTGKLVEIGSALSQSDVDIKLNNFQFTCEKDKPGVYSIILTVYDRAGNTAKARKIITYNDEPITISNSPMYLDKADPTTIDVQSGHAFINKLEDPQDGIFHFTANWTGHFVNNYKPEWLARVKSWQDLGIAGIDDNYGSKYSMRSIDQVTGLTGIISFSYAYEIDSVGGIGAIPPENFTQLTDKQTTLTLDIPKDQLKNGQTIVVWVKAYDITGSSSLIVSKTFVDTDRYCINVTGAVFKSHSSDQFNSSVLIHVENRISGIKNISYQIIDVTLDSSVIKSVTVLPQILRPKNILDSISRRRRRQSSVEKPCDPKVDTTCYCIPLGDCYNKTQEILIDNCWIDRHAGNHLKVVYTITSLSGLSIGGFQDLGTPAVTDIPCRPPPIPPSFGGLSGGAVAGIVIGIIIGCILLIIAIVLFVLSRIKPNHAIPTRMRTMAHTVHNKFAQPAMMESELYLSREDYVKNVNEPKFKSTMAAENKESFGCNVSSKSVQAGDIVAEGRFATIRKGFFCQNNQNVPVALKALRRDHAQRDDDLMRSKILFMAKLKPHPNIVKFIGAVEDDNSSDAPVMLLEYCDISLKDWLSNITKVTTDELENMLTFSLNIANGVEHLHKQKIIHRRLAMRNVLLKNGMNGLEAKLIGFGPSRDIAEDNANEESGQQAAAVVPMKWLAPETLDSLRSKRPVYDEKTDAWSYAVTIWEIYSKGAAPFSNYRSNDMRDVLKRGERMTCPDECPTEVFNKVVYPCWNISPKKRPTFSMINSHLHQFKNGSDEGASYYAPGEGGSGSGGSGGYYDSSGAGRASMYPGQQQQLYHDAR